MKALVIGLGALGTVYSCLLSLAGHEVTGLSRPASIDEIRSNGVKVTGIWGAHRTKLANVVSDVSELAGQTFDMIIVTVKSFITEEIAEKIAPLVGDTTFVFLLQNGYGNFEAAAKSIPEEKLVLGRVIFGAETLAPGESKVTVIADDVLIGSPKKLIDPVLLDEFARIFSKALIPTVASSEIMQYIWGKIIYNSALNSLGSIFEVSYGELAKEPVTRELMNKIIREIFDLLQARNIPMFWPDAQTYLLNFYDYLLPPTSAHHSSMLQDIRSGRQTEIEALNGAVVKLAHESRVPVPVNEIIVAMVKAKESFSLRTKEG
ncbi:ketopantoate reductase family protein [Desulfosporosinus sp.]|uniref:ketopantoate reductase family protein n=1 Tax=Desulfosporosinus sp. TaxID=157907 RepID=UPI0025C13AC1|nr:ketopantoate reductase family protein [Desulfosporosinus sp.]MBC2723902.1 ketopantoate reductase family protein [Desulfosporosinus sp.]MBC2726557.1 ketopantoate reductase family protein [Desulfosporosinus sp.]